jgi:DNA-binding transcriptional LysR family regulator
VELRQLELVLAVAEERHFTRAAARSHIGQSALSASVAGLERELGCPLFNRTTRQVELTAAGEAFVIEARRTLAAAQRAGAAVDEVRDLLRGTLVLGGITTTGTLDQTAVLAEFSRRHRDVDLRYTRGSSPDLIEGVLQGRLDLACVSRPARLSPGLAGTDLWSEPIVFLCRPDHHLAHRVGVTLADMAGETFVGPARHSVGSALIDRVLAGGPVDHRVPFEVNEPEAILDFVEHGLGVSFLQAPLVRTRPGLLAIPVDDPGVGVVWTLTAVTRELGETSPATRAFLELLEEEARTRGPVGGEELRG